MKNLYLIILCIITCHATCLAQSTGRITGKVNDAEGLPMAGANVLILETGAGTATDSAGEFSFKNVRAGQITLKVSFVGYADVVENLKIKANSVSEITIKLSVSPVAGDEVVITSSRRPEKITRAPASISVISAHDVEQSASINPAELASKVQGVEFVRTGVNNISINARGFNNAFNTKILQMTDGRNSMLAGANGLPPGMMNTVIKEDIERLEIVLGPNSALYGPNAHNGIFNTITKDPRKYQGTTVALTAGNRQVFSGRFRHADKINGHWAYKVTGEYTTGKDFNFKDSVYAGGGVYGPAVVIPERISSYQFKYIKGEAHLFYNFTPRSYAAVTYGKSNSTYLNVTNLTRNYQQDWIFTFLQGRFVSPHLFVQLYQTWADAGKTFGVASYTRDFWNRTHSTITDPANPAFAATGYLAPDQAEAYAMRVGNVFKEKSKRLNSEIQYNYDFENAGLFLIASATYQKDKPDTYGSILVDKIQKVDITQYGAALQIEKTLPADIKFTAAARIDHHSLFGEMFSPKFGMVKGIGAGAVRLTWGRAFAAPIILFQRASVFGLIFGNGNGVKYIPNGANVNDPAAITTTSPLNPEQINTWELGYKGKVTRKIYVDVNAYYGKSKNFLSPAISVGGRTLSVGNFSIETNTLLYPGTVTNSGILNGAAFSTYFNYGEVSSYGMDAGLNYYATSKISMALKYSWFGSDITSENIKNDANKDGYVAVDERSLNAPKNRVMGSISLQDLFHSKVFCTISARWVQQFDMYSGSQIGTKAGEGKRGSVYGGKNPINDQPRYYAKNFDWGPVGGFTTVEISAGYKVSELMSLNGSVSNLFDTKQVEFVASPSIGRLYSLELKVNVPARNNKKSD
ncbi:hypothetical protein Dfri01_31340 [Dyadobacter frigoris]|uniref:TonB-dependent receptor n=1 Tax=Dyadobacter frigoris TaxID=2576211 RepID=UPI0024A4008D|nr:TonB-dependent receptor [Dyadobacter frigoris]GLU53673.1 hypothetical protein Dfri01_31340 [Dyadobacter frigoris]